MHSIESKLKDFYRSMRRMPSYSELMGITGLKSKNSVSRLVKKLVEEGVVDKDSTGRIIPNHLWGRSRLLGTVEAGWPSPAEEELVDTMSLDEYLIGNKEATYLLKVKGESMVEAGIMPGDMVLVERGRNPRNGDIVIAEVDGEWTMKYFERQGGSVALRPANKKFSTIVPQEELSITAVVVGVIRKYLV